MIMSSLISKKIKHHIRNEFINDYNTGNYDRKKHLDLIRKETEIIEELNEKQLILKNFKNLPKIKNIVCEERVIIENCNISDELSNIKTKYLSITGCNIKNVSNLNVKRLKISKCNIEGDLYLKDLEELYLNKINMPPKKEKLCYFKYLWNIREKGGIKLIENVKKLELSESVPIYLRVNFTEMKNIEKVIFNGNTHTCNISDFTFTKNVYILARNYECFIKNYREKCCSNFETVRIIEGAVDNNKINVKYLVNVNNLRLNNCIKRLDCLGNIKFLNLCSPHYIEIKKYSNYSYLNNNIKSFSFISDKDVNKKKLNLPNNLVLVKVKIMNKSYGSYVPRTIRKKCIKFKYIARTKEKLKKEKGNQNI